MEILLGLVLVLIWLISLVPKYILSRINWKKQTVPPIKNSLLKLSATALAEKIRNGDLSSQTVVEAYIERINEVNPFINAVIEERFDAALNEAKKCDVELRKGKVTVATLSKEKPLYGVPITVKESCSLKGMSLTGGSLFRKGMRATEDGSAVELLRYAGAIPLLVSNTSELCTALNSYNFLFGATMNPYDTRKTAGGSSGGECALITCGASILGIGSDFIGSIRVPAFFNGIFGHKPTAAIVPIDGHFPLSDDAVFRKMIVLGPVARYVDDLYLAMKVLNSKCERPLQLDKPVDIHNLRVFYANNVSTFCSIGATSSDVKQIIYKATQYLSDQGARVEKMPQYWLNDVMSILISLFTDMDLPFYADTEGQQKKNPYFEFAKSIVGLSDYTPTRTFARMFIHTKILSSSKIKDYLKIKDECTKIINDALKDNGVLICPSFPHEAPFRSVMLFEITYNIYCSFANYMYLPATHIPMGLNKNGLPIGLQVISASYQDHICLAVAKELEKVFGGWVPPN